MRWPAPPRASALHQSSFQNLRLRFNYRSQMSQLTVTHPINTMIGALIVAVIRASMVYLDIPAQGQQFFFGCVLIAAIALTIDRRKVRTVK